MLHVSFPSPHCAALRVGWRGHFCAHPGAAYPARRGGHPARAVVEPRPGKRGTYGEGARGARRGGGCRRASWVKRRTPSII